MDNIEVLVNSEASTNVANLIGIVFNNWTALKISLDHGLAGPPLVAAGKVQALAETVQQALLSGNSDWISLSDTLADVMDSQFCVELEDNSNDEVAKHLFHLYGLLSSGSFQELITEISVLPNKTPINVGPPEPSFQQQAAPADVRDDQDNETDGDMEDGWTTVKRR